jgi:putative ABC transport system substrate-binding protein
MRLRRVGIIITLALSLLCASRTANAQPAGKVQRIGWLVQGDLDRASRDALLHSLRAMGYVEGHNLVIEYRSGGGTFARLPTLATDLVRLPVEVLVAQGVAAFAAKEATSTLPIVFVGVVDPVDRGLIASWPQPGGNITGAAGPSLDFNAGKSLELLKEVVPAATRMAVVVNPDHPLYGASRQKLQATARLLQVGLHFMEVRDPATELARVFAALAHTHIEALCVIGDMSFLPHRARLVELVAASQLPAIYLHRPYVHAGGLMSYEPDPLAMQRRAGIMVGKILQGAKPADIPAEAPMKYELTINLKTAKALGITMPPALLLLADEVIQ